MILLDTHVVLWLVGQPERLSRAASRALKGARERIIADVTLREIASLAEHGRIALHRETAEWLERAIAELGLTVVPIDPRIAARSVRIAQGFHGDPADQLIAATAIELDVSLVTADENLRASPALRTIW